LGLKGLINIDLEVPEIGGFSKIKGILKDTGGLRGISLDL